LVPWPAHLLSGDQLPNLTPTSSAPITTKFLSLSYRWCYLHASPSESINWHDQLNGSGFFSLAFHFSPHRPPHPTCSLPPHGSPLLASSHNESYRSRRLWVWADGKPCHWQKPVLMKQFKIYYWVCIFESQELSCLQEVDNMHRESSPTREESFKSSHKINVNHGMPSLNYHPYLLSHQNPGSWCSHQNSKMRSTQLSFSVAFAAKVSADHAPWTSTVTTPCVALSTIQSLSRGFQEYPGIASPSQFPEALPSNDTILTCNSQHMSATNRSSLGCRMIPSHSGRAPPIHGRL